MKRFHVHVAVSDLPASIDFYSKLFGQVPSKQKPDYAKWMLDDPRLNFAISSRGHAGGVNHFGMQAEDLTELANLKALAGSAAGGAVVDEAAAACCYAKSEKHWTIDPQGIAWEHFVTMEDAETFGEDTPTQSGACCIPLRKSGSSDAQPAGACCVPTRAAEATGSCCP
jgi:catechol 2,3-dioxygenase-like lactoylglutathione lyase family enzyme